MAAKTVQAVVFVNSNNDAVVFPPVLLAAKGDTVEIFNTSGDDVVVMYPADVFDTEGGGGPNPPVDPKKSTKVVGNNEKAGKKINGATLKKGRVPYKVFSFSTNDFAKGNSDPEFIIEP